MRAYTTLWSTKAKYEEGHFLNYDTAGAEYQGSRRNRDRNSLETRRPVRTTEKSDAPCDDLRCCMFHLLCLMELHIPRAQLCLFTTAHRHQLTPSPLRARKVSPT